MGTARLMTRLAESFRGNAERKWDERPLIMVNDLYGKPFQLRFIRPAEMLMFAKAVCDPPLGQATTVPFGQQSVRSAIRPLDGD